MRKIVFIGGYDKSDIILYMSKILSLMDKRILVIDTTLLQKMRYIIPTMTPTAKYVSTYDGIDIALGFDNMQDLIQYLGIANFADEYDYIIYDIDNPVYYESFEIAPQDVHCMLTTFDVYAVTKGVEVLRGIKEPTEILKVLVTRDPASEESEYLDFVSFNLKIKWKEDIVYIPFDTEDLYEIYLNQRSSRVKFTGLSMDYMESLSFLIENLTDCSSGEIKRAVKMIEREG